MLYFQADNSLLDISPACTPWRLQLGWYLILTFLATIRGGREVFFPTSDGKREINSFPTRPGREPGFFLFFLKLTFWAFRNAKALQYRTIGIEVMNYLKSENEMTDSQIHFKWSVCGFGFKRGIMFKNLNKLVHKVSRLLWVVYGAFYIKDSFQCAYLHWS